MWYHIRNKKTVKTEGGDLNSVVFKGIPTDLQGQFSSDRLGTNVISTEARVKPERSGEIPRGSQPITILPHPFCPYLVGEADGRAVRPRTAA